MSQEKAVKARFPFTARLAELQFRLTLRFPAIVALVVRLMLLVPAGWWPGRNRLFIRWGFSGWSDFARIPRQDAVWAAYTRAGAPAYAPEFAYEDDFLPDHAGETYRGVGGLRRAWIGFVEAFDEVAYDLERIDGSGDRLVSIHRVKTKAGHTGIAQDFRVAYIWTFRAGRISHCRGLRNVDEARIAVGQEK